ncbi:MAG: hypothetical protein QUV05_22665 [Phycisphaerae bacterium]|nr:hypothetical protein [Phycisphaerae bacterium]
MATPKTRGRTPSLKEGVIGLLILILLAVMVFTFVLSGGLFDGVVERVPVLQRLKGIIGLREDRLFDIALGNMTSASPPVEIQIARRLLPAARPEGDGHYAVYAVGPGEKVDVIREAKGPGDSTRVIVRSQEEPDALAKEAAGFGTGWLYASSRLAKDAELLLRVVDTGQPSNAEKLAAARKPANAKALSLGRGGWQDESSGACGFWSGRYYTEVALAGGPAVGLDQVADLRQIAADLAANQLAYGSEIEVVEPSVKEPGDKALSAVARVADFASVPGGQVMPPSKIDRFTDNLYEKIDGKEGMFRSFHFVALRFAQYTHAQTQESFDAYIYDMGEPVNAFGIYMGERSPTAKAWSLGRDAYVSGSSAFFCKDKYYVHVLGPPEGGDDKLEVSKAIATAIAATIPDTDKPFWVEQHLPAEGRTPNSLKYEATSGLGYDFIQRMFRAEYQVEGKTFQLFVVRAADAAAARVLFDKYTEATAKYDRVVSKGTDAQGQKVIGESLGFYSVAFTKGVFFGGVTECEDQALAVKQAEAFRAMLPADAEGATEPPVSAPADGEQG